MRKARIFSAGRVADSCRGKQAESQADPSEPPAAAAVAALPAQLVRHRGKVAKGVTKHSSRLQFTFVDFRARK